MDQSDTFTLIAWRFDWVALIVSVWSCVACCKLGWAQTTVSSLVFVLTNSRLWRHIFVSVFHFQWKTVVENTEGVGFYMQGSCQRGGSCVMMMSVITTLLIRAAPIRDGRVNMWRRLWRNLRRSGDLGGRTALTSDSHRPLSAPGGH